MSLHTCYLCYCTVHFDPSKTLKDIKIDPTANIKHAEKLRQDAIRDFNQVSGIFKDLENIAQEIKAGKIQDAKDAADLTNRIQLNTALITAMSAKYDMMQKQFEQQQEQVNNKTRTVYG